MSETKPPYSWQADFSASWELWLSIMRERHLQEQYLPATFEGRLWRLAEEMIEVLERAHKATCKVGRFGPRADLTGTHENRNNAKLLLGELDDLQHAMNAIRPELEEWAAK